MRLSVVVPMLNEAGSVAATLRAVRQAAPRAEIIVVDGGSSDSSRDFARPWCDRLIEARRGRARQMNAGAAVASGDVLAFVHADTIVPASFERDIELAMREAATVGGRFDLQLDHPGIAFRLIGAMVNFRSRMSRTGTGDQALFLRRQAFEQLGGFPDLEICEDLALTRRLKRIGQVACLRSRVTTSARRWRKRGLARTVVLMWTVRALFLLGVPARRLAYLYRDVR